MANVLDDAVVDQIFARGFMALRENAIMPRLINTNYEDEVAEQGDTIQITIPSAATVSDVTPGPTPPAGQDVQPDKATIVLNRWRQTEMHLTDKEIREITEGYESTQITEHVRAIANDVDNYVLGLYKKVWATAGAEGTTPFASDLSEAIDTRKVLNDNLAPKDPRSLVLNTAAEANALQNRAIQDATFRMQGPDSLRTASIGDVLGFQWNFDQNMPTHAQGSLTGDPTVNGAHSIGVESVSVATDADDAVALNEGDIITFAGDTQQYAVTADASVGASSSVSVGIIPSLQVALSGGEAVTLVTSAGHEVNLGFHRDAFGLATRTLRPTFLGGNLFRTAQDPITGLGISLEISREHMRTKMTWSILYGADCVRPALAARLLG